MEREHQTRTTSLDIESIGYVGNDLSGSDYGFGTPQSIGLDALNVFMTDDAPETTSAQVAQPIAGGKGSSYLPSRRIANQHGQPSGLQQSPSPAHQFSGRDGRKGGLNFSGQSSPDFADDASQPLTHRARRISGNDGLDENAAVLGHGDDSGRSADAHTRAPSWSELKTKAGKERKRLPLACIACRRKKIRCSGEKPACKHCLRSRIPCVYKITARRAAPRTDYMAMLDKRLKRMEERVIRIIPKQDQEIVASTGRADVRPSLSSSAVGVGAGQKKRVAEQAFDHELDHWASGDTDSAAAGPQSAGKARDGQARHDDSDDQSLLIEGAEALPTKEIQEHLAEVFFDFVYGQSYHLLHKPSFMRKLARGTVPPVLVLSVCAIAARFSNHPAVRTEPAFLRGEMWAAPARKIALSRYDTPNITILITFLILGLHEFGTCQGGRSWMLGGMAQRMAYALRLHQDLDNEPRQDKAERQTEGLTATDREIRRRTMWSCFLMDRFNSSGTDRPLFVAKQYIRAQLPIKEAYFQMEITGPTEDLEGHVPHPAPSDNGTLADAKANMGVAAYLIRLVSIWGQIIHYINLGGKERDRHPPWDEASTFQGIKRSVDQWRNQLPAALHYSAGNLDEHASEKTANQFLFMHIVYHQIILFMHRFALPAPGTPAVFPKDMPTEFVQASSKAALEAANEISRLVHEAMDHSVVAPFAGYCAFYSSTVHINGAFSKNATLEASSKQNLAWNVKYLTKMKKYWGMFHYMTENLRELYRRYADAARNGDAAKLGPEGQTGAPIFQYGDWFDRYPHGVSERDFEEPSAKAKVESGADGVLGHKSDLQTVEEFFSKLAPPSRAATLPSPGSHPTSGRKKKRTKSQAQSARPQHDLPAPADTDRPRASTELQPTSYSQPTAATDEVLVDSGFTAPMGFPSFAGSMPMGGFQTPTAGTSEWMAAQLMSQLDRQMVLNSYSSGNGDVVAMPPPTAAGLDTDLNSSLAHSTYDPFGLDAFSGMSAAAMMNHGGGLSTPANRIGNLSGEAASGATGYWGEPSTAWFMPFNVDPPSVRGEAEEPSLAVPGSDPMVDWTSF